MRERPDGTAELIAEGYEYPVPMSQAVGGEVHSWTERRLVVRSVRQRKQRDPSARGQGDSAD